MQSLHDFQTKTLTGRPFDFAALKGKKVLLVNVASQCGLTKQYKDLQDLYKEFGGKNFEIVGFPANNFGGQEPGTAEEIQKFCALHFGVEFLMMNKVSVQGEDADPIFKWLTQKAQNGVADIEVTWNFQKFLIDEQGRLVKSISPERLPIDEEILNWIAG